MAAIILLHTIHVSTAVADDTGDSSGLQLIDPGSDGGDICLVDIGASCNVGGDAGSNTRSASPNSSVGNPISVITGNKYQLETDYQSVASKLQFNRHYNSHNADSNLGFGQGWSSTFSTRLVSIPDSGYAIVQGTGKRVNFYESAVDSTGREVFRAYNASMGYLYEQNGKQHWALPDGRTISFSGSYLVKIDYPGHQFLELFYKNLQLAEVKDEAGRLLAFEYYPEQQGLLEFSDSRFRALPFHLSKLTLPDGTAIEYDYDEKQNVSRVRYSDGTSKVYQYDNESYPNHLTGMTDRAGEQFASWSYHPDGSAASSEHAGGAERVDIEYFPPESYGGVGTSTVTNSQGNISTYTWQTFPERGQSLLLTSEGEGCITCPETGMQYTYNDSFQISTVTDESGKTWQFEYDEIGRTIALTETDMFGIPEQVIRREYVGDSSRPAAIIQPSVNPTGEHRIEIGYNDDQLPTQIIERGWSPQGPDSTFFEAVESVTKLYYTDGRLTSFDGPRNDVDDITQYEHDSLGRVIKVVKPTGMIITIGDYDEHGRANSYQFGSQSPIQVAFDQHGNIEKLSLRGDSFQYRYDSNNQLRSIIDANGKSVELDYDNAGRLIKYVDDIGRVAEFENNTESQVTSRKFFGLDGDIVRSLDYVYDARGRVESFQDQSQNYSDGSPINDQTDVTYDYRGRITQVDRSAEEDSSQILYDTFGRVTGVETNGVPYSQMEYDIKGQDIGYSDSRGNRTLFIKDDFGRVVTLVSPDTGTTQYVYDEAGNRIQKTNADNQVTNYIWDAGDRLVSETTPDDSIAHVYHPSNERLSETHNNESSEYFEFNSDAQLIKHTRELGGFLYSTAYEYDDRGRQTKRVLADGQTLRYHYHESGVNAGKLRAITRETLLGLRQETLVGEIDSEVRDGSTSLQHHNGVRTQYNYHANGQISSIEVDNTLSLHYEYDNDGNIVGIDLDAVAQDYIYNNGSLVEAHTQLGDFYYDYDSVANRTFSIENLHDGTSSSAQYEYANEGSGNRLLSITSQQTEDYEYYDYNQSGSPLVAGGEYRYEYNAQQRPIAVYKHDQLIAEYGYNSFGERIKKVAYSNNQSTVTYYLYDGHTLTAEINEDGSVASQYIYTLDNKLVGKLEGKAFYAVHTDHLGTPQRMTDAQGQLVWNADYTPFGKASVSLEKVKLNIRLPGQYEDEETGTHYNYYRDYDPATGRYITSDPIGLKGGVNTYAYLAGDPLNGSDSMGLSEDSEFLAQEDGSLKPIADAGFLDKAGFALDYLDDYAIEAGKQEIANMLNPDNIAVMIGMMGGIAAIQFVPGLNVVVNSAMLAWAWWNFGSAGWDLIKAIFNGIRGINSARTARSLCNASRNFANALIGVLANLPPAKFGRFLEKGKQKTDAEGDKHNVDTDNPNTTCGLNRSSCTITTAPGKTELTFPHTYYTKNPDGSITGISKTYTPTGHQTEIDGNVFEAYKSGGQYYVFKDNKQHRIKDPNPNALKNHYTGLVGEQRVANKLDELGYEPVAGTNTLGKKTNLGENDIKDYVGINGIDGIYKKDGKYIIVESKATAGNGSTGSLNQTQSGQQMSKDWLLQRIDKLEGMNPNERLLLRQQIINNEVTRLKAEIKNVDTGDLDSGTTPSVNGDVTFKEIENSTGTEPNKNVIVGDEWDGT